MSYTNVEQVRHHLVAAHPTADRVLDQPVVLQDDYVKFFNGPVDAGSLVVKSPRTGQPGRIQLTLGSGVTAFASGPIVAGSVVVASDSSLGTVHTESVDYVVDHATGALSIKEGGELLPGQSVTVWFQSFAVYEAGVDYQLDARSGRMQRLNGGTIATGETVIVDYTPLIESFTDELLSKAVVEANGLIEREIDPEGQFGADPVLQAAATYQALEIVSRAAASRELSNLRGADRVALAWIRLAESYAVRAQQLLQAFRPPLTGPARPQHG